MSHKRAREQTRQKKNTKKQFIFTVKLHLNFCITNTSNAAIIQMSSTYNWMLWQEYHLLITVFWKCHFNTLIYQYT